MKESEEIRQALRFVAVNGLEHEVVVNACDVLGINSEELIEKSTKDFTDRFGGRDITEFNYRNYEARRRAKLALIGRFISDKTHTSPRLGQLLISPNSKSKPAICPLLPTSPRFGLAQRNHLKKLKVAENLKEIKINEEKTRKFYEERLNSKSSRGTKTPFSNERKSRYAQRELKTQAILIKKYKDIEDHEIRAISSMSARKTILITQSSFNTPKKPSRLSTSKQSLSSVSHQEELSIDEKLSEISMRLARSSERAKQRQEEKIVSMSSLTGRVNQVKAVKELIDSKLEAKNIQKVFRIKKDFTDSCRRKEKLLEGEQKRISISLKKQSNRWNDEYLKVEQAYRDRERRIEQRIKEKERTRDGKLGQRSLIRKKEDVSISKIQKKYEEIRGKMMARFKDIEMINID